MIDGHTCITDDGGTPGRRCHACEAEKPKRRGPKPVEPERRTGVPLQIRMTPGERARIKKARESENISTDAELIRDAIDEYCDRRNIAA